MSTDNADDALALYEELTDPLLASEQAQEGTLMGFPCLRTPDGAFFTTTWHDTGDLIVKIPASRVDALIEAGTGLPFAPAGRRFREWVQVPGRDAALWRTLLDEALAFAAAGHKSD